MLPKEQNQEGGASASILLEDALDKKLYKTHCEVKYHIQFLLLLPTMGWNRSLSKKNEPNQNCPNY